MVIDKQSFSEAQHSSSLPITIAITDLTLTPCPLLFNNFSYFQSFQNFRPCAKFSKISRFAKTMADKFYLNFQDNVILGQGYKFKKEANQNCFDFIVKENPNDSHPTNDVQMEPVTYIKKEWLYGPATCLASRRIIYPCSRF